MKTKDVCMTRNATITVNLTAHWFIVNFAPDEHPTYIYCSIPHLTWCQSITNSLEASGMLYVPISCKIITMVTPHCHITRHIYPVATYLQESGMRTNTDSLADMTGSATVVMFKRFIICAAHCWFMPMLFWVLLSGLSWFWSHEQLSLGN